MESSVRVAVSSISGSLGLSPRRAPLPSLSMHKAYPVRGSSTEARFISLTRRRHWPRPAQARATMVSTCTSTSIEATHVLHMVLVHRRPPNKSQLQVHLFPDRQPFKPKREKTSKRTQVLSAEHHTTYALVTVAVLSFNIRVSTRHIGALLGSCSAWSAGQVPTLMFRLRRSIP